MNRNTKIGLELTLVSLDAKVPSCPESNHSYDPEFDDERSVLTDGCEILAESRALSFVVIVLGERWPVDVETDLAIILEQLPETLFALRECKPAVLEFYEQGIERVLSFSGDDEKTIDLRCEGQHQEWRSGGLNASLIRGETIAMLQKLGDDFVDFLGQGCSDLANHPWLTAWQSRFESNTQSESNTQ